MEFILLRVNVVVVVVVVSSFLSKLSLVRSCFLVVWRECEKE